MRHLRCGSPDGPCLCSPHSAARPGCRFDTEKIEKASRVSNWEIRPLGLYEHGRLHGIRARRGRRDRIVEYSVIIPAHNEAANLEAFVTHFVDRLPKEVSEALREVILVE